MPRSAVIALAFAAAFFVPDYAAAVEEGVDAATGGDKDESHVDLSVSGADGTCGGAAGYDHVDFSVESIGDKDEGHVDLSVDGADSATGDDRGQGHVDFSVEGDDKGDSHVDLSLDPSGAYTVEAEIAVGAEAAEICGQASGGEGSDVGLRIAVHPDGRIEVNGRELAVCDPARGCRISLAWSPGTGAVVVQAEDASGAVCAAQYAMEGAPEGVRISAAEVRSLSVRRQ